MYCDSICKAPVEFVDMESSLRIIRLKGSGGQLYEDLMQFRQDYSRDEFYEIPYRQRFHVSTNDLD